MTKEISKDETFDARAEIAYNLPDNSQANRGTAKMLFGFGNILASRYLLDEHLFPHYLMSLAPHLPEDCRTESEEGFIATLNEVLGESGAATVGIYDIQESGHEHPDWQKRRPFSYVFKMNQQNEEAFWEQVIARKLF
jgi:hypothetical protein